MNNEINKTVPETRTALGFRQERIKDALNVVTAQLERACGGKCKDCAAFCVEWPGGVWMSSGTACRYGAVPMDQYDSCGEFSPATGR